MAGFGLAAGAGFASGFGQAFNQSFQKQQELQLEKQRLQQQQQRELMARADAQRAELWKNIEEQAHAMLAAGNSPNSIMTALAGPVQILTRFTKASGRDDKLIPVQLGMILNAPTSADVAARGGPAATQSARATPSHDPAFDQAPQSFTPGMPAVDVGPIPGSADPVSFMSGHVGGASKPAAGPNVTPPQVQSILGGGGGQPQQNAGGDNSQEIDNLTRAMSIARTPGEREAYKMHLHEAIKRQAGGAGDHVLPIHMKDGTVILYNKDTHSAMDLNGHPIVVPTGAGSGNDDIAQIADAIESGNQPPKTTGLYGKGPGVRAELQRRKFNLSKADLEYKAAEKQIQSLDGPQMSRFYGLAQSVQGTMDDVLELSKQMNLSGINAANQFELQAFIKAEGNSENGQLATEYIAAVNTLKEEFANLAAGGYSPTEPAWKLADEQINANYGVKQMAAAIPELKRLIQYRLNAIPNFGTMGPGSANRYVPGSGQPPAKLPPIEPAPAKKKNGGWEIEEIK